MKVKIFIPKKLKKNILLAASLSVLFITSLFCVTFCLHENNSSNKSESIKLPVIMYHLVLKNPGSKNRFIVSEKTFENDLKYIKNNGFTTILVKDLIDYTENKKELPEKPILLTFDDGAYNNYLYAFPLAQKYNARFVFSPIGKEADRYEKTKDENPSYSHTNWEKIIEMSKSELVEIQNHTYNMHGSKKPRIGCTKAKNETDEKYKENLAKDLLKEQKLIEEKTGIKPTAFFYPFGAISDKSEEIIKSLGFKATFDCENKMNFITKNPACLFRLHRFLRPPDISSEEFFDKINKNK